MFAGLLVNRRNLQIAGKTLCVSELTTKLSCENNGNGRGNDLGYGKNVRLGDEFIRSQASR